MVYLLIFRQLHSTNCHRKMYFLFFLFYHFPNHFSDCHNSPNPDPWLVLFPKMIYDFIANRSRYRLFKKTTLEVFIKFMFLFYKTVIFHFFYWIFFKWPDFWINPSRHKLHIFDLLDFKTNGFRKSHLSVTRGKRWMTRCQSANFLKLYKAAVFRRRISPQTSRD